MQRTRLFLCAFAAITALACGAALLFPAAVPRGTIPAAPATELAGLSSARDASSAPGPSGPISSSAPSSNAAAEKSAPAALAAPFAAGPFFSSAAGAAAPGLLSPADFAPPGTKGSASAKNPESRALPRLTGGNPGERPFASAESSFSLHKAGPGGGPTLLIVGGIQGDEPGGFSAAALVASRYRITRGQVWVVPDLNFASILQRGRGLFGDMNRKFAALSSDDPEYALVEAIKAVLLDDSVDLVLNLHDGSGFYRPTFEDALRNPNRWGQSVIIDQEGMEARRFGNLSEMAATAVADANNSLLNPGHRYHTHNTNTRAGDKEMEKTLSYFAVCSGKPAFGVEASKDFTTEFRVFYHLGIIESFMRQMGIGYERGFELTPGGVLAALNSDLTVTAYGDRLVLPLDNARPDLGLLPFKKGADPEYRASKPLLALVRDREDWRVAYGNRTLTRVRPAFMEFDESLDTVEISLDGKKRTARVGEVLHAKNSFMIHSRPGYRVNAIGAQKDKSGTEAGVTIARADFMPRYSVDKNATTYRVEFYKDKAFAGMILVRFGPDPAPPAEPLTATKGPESSFGF